MSIDLTGNLPARLAVGALQPTQPSPKATEGGTAANTGASSTGGGAMVSGGANVGALASGPTSPLWTVVTQTHPLTVELRPLADQALEKLLHSLGPGNTPLKSTSETLASASMKMIPAPLLQNPNTTGAGPLMPKPLPSALGTAALLNSTLLSSSSLSLSAQHQHAQITRLLQADQLFLVRVNSDKQPLHLIMDESPPLGTKLQLLVTPTAAKLIQTAAPNTPPLDPQKTVNTPLTSEKSALWRKALPLQQGATLSLSRLQQLAPQLTVQPSLVKTLAQLASANTLSLPPTPQSVKQAINNSGLFAEARLAQLVTAPQGSQGDETLAPPVTDAKMLLWRLIAQTSAAPIDKSAHPLLGQLLSILGLETGAHRNTHESQQQLKDAAKQWLAKIVTQQLAALSQEPSNKEAKLFQIEVPVKLDQQLVPLELQITKYWQAEDSEPEPQQTHTAPKATPVWQVTLSIHVPTLGNIDARIRYINQQLQCSLWADQPETYALMQQESAALAHKIRDRGLNVESITCLCGRMTTPTNQLNSPLLDTHA